MAEPPSSKLFEVVGRLQSRLVLRPTPQKLLKYLKRLSVLPITLDILTETGVGKTVNALRKYESVTAFARGLVAQWKKLAQAREATSQNEGPELWKPKKQGADKQLERRLSRKRNRDALLKEREVAGHEQDSEKASHSQPRSNSEGREKKYRKLDKNLKVLPKGETRKKEKSRGEDMKGKKEKEGSDAKTEETGKNLTRGKGESREGRKREKWEAGKVEMRRKGETGEVGTTGKGKTGKVGEKGDTKVQKKEEKRRDGKRSGKQFSVLSKSHALLLQASRNSQWVSVDYEKPNEKKANQLRSPQRPRKRHHQVIHDDEEDSPKRCLVKPEVKVAIQHHHHQSKGHKSSEEKKSQMNNEGKRKSFKLSQEKLPKVASREEGSNPSSKISLKEKQAVPSSPKGSGSKKKSGPPSEMTPGKFITKPKDRDAQKTKVKKSSRSVDSFHEETQRGKLTPEVKDKKGSHKLKTQEKRKGGLNAKKAPSQIQGTQKSDEDDDFEKHSMSFESYLLYDQPKKKIEVKTPTSGSRKKDQQNLKSVRPEIKSHHLQNSNQPKTYQAGTDSANPRASSAVIPALLALHSPSRSSSVKAACQTLLSLHRIYGPLSFGELNPACQSKKQVPFISPEEKIAELSMSSIDCKMKDYLGFGNPYSPKVPSLYELCIKVLRKNIDLIYEVGQIPYNMLIPVLEKCSPEQLYKIEEYNPQFLEDSDNLWKIHCSRDFRRESPEEFESWREMYLRLHDSQERRLHHLAISIQSAHSRKLKVRQTKMVFINPVSRSPCDVPGRQMLKVEGTIALKNADIKPIQHTSKSRNPSDSDNNQSQKKELSDGPSTSSPYLAPPGSNASSQQSMKKTRKKVAPLMAKSLKTLKNRFSRS